MHACIYAHAHACLFCVHAGHWLEMMPSVQQLAAQSTNFFGIFFHQRIARDHAAVAVKQASTSCVFMEYPQSTVGAEDQLMC
mmetsp:Transcript_86301/g.143563  ORF Transcript_86301/g.143563 Transcript_86301/m.143563 type:complete len:82 (-) Transcript_86301:651-896(-)